MDTRTIGGGIPLSYEIISQCSITKARAGTMKLIHADITTPVFMPVGTQGTLKGILPAQLMNMDCYILLGNTYHLGSRPGINVLAKAGGLHKFMAWPRAILTDSGGFQMVSLVKLAEIDENGVNFRSPFDNSQYKLTPEHSIEIQNIIGADIIMQLDDVVQTTTRTERIEEAMQRTLRWLDRCISVHGRLYDQSLFPIVQGGLNYKLREQCIDSLSKKSCYGYAIGGLSGGESKGDFWRVVHKCTDILPSTKPRYLMGVGLAVDLVVAVALGIDMFDCVFPTRTARFGSALIQTGQINLKHPKYKYDMQPIDMNCRCSTCRKYSRSYLHHIVIHESVASSLLSVHNITFQLNLMMQMRQAIIEQTFPNFIINFISNYFKNESIPEWIVQALSAVNIYMQTVN